MADAKVLLDTLRSNTLAIHSLLENVKHSQMLQDKSAACEWITTSNKLLISNKDRWKGICLLRCLVEQCGTELFNENCLSWLKTLLQILQQEKQNINLCKYVSEVLEKILSFSVQFSEIARQISLTVIPPLLTAVLSDKNMNLEVSMFVIRTCIQHYPGASGSFVKRIENLILQVFDSDNYFQIQIACSCFALLSKCGSSSGTGLDKQTASWETQWKKILSTLSAVIDDFYSHFKAGSTNGVNSETFQLKSIPVVEPQRTEACVSRIKCMLKCLDLMLRNEFCKSVNIPLDSTMKIIQDILAVNEKSVKNNVALESVLFKSNISAVHFSAIQFLSSLILSCGMSLLPYHHSITRILLLELSWSESDEKVNGFQQKYSELRSAVYDCVQYLIHVTSSVGENSDKIKKILCHVLEDVRPRVTTTKLLAPTASTSKAPSHGKKAKRKRVQDDVTQLNRTEQKTNYHANKDLCLSGLQVLNSVILKGGNDIPSDILKEVQVFVVTLLLECQQVSMSTLRCNYPIPYGSPDCRKMLYKLLQSFLYNHNPRSPPPIQHAIMIFSQGTQDHDFEISKFCTEAQMMCHVLIHPRVAVMSSSINLSLEQEIAEKQSSVKPKDTHIDDLRENVKMTVDSNNDQPFTNPSGNGQLIFEKIDDSVHSTTSSTSANSAHGHSYSDLPNTNKDTSEMVRETHQLHEEMTSDIVLMEKQNEITEETIKENQDNIKRSLPKGFDELTDKVLSELIDDTVPTVKRRKTQDVTTSSNIEEGVSNNNNQNKEPTTFRDEIIGTGEDEKLAEEMINSFVNSVPD